jgi:hypothetical protein
MKKLILLAALSISTTSQAQVLNFKCLYHQSPTVYDQYLDVTLDLKKNIIYDFRTYQEFEINDSTNHVIISELNELTSKEDSKTLTIYSPRVSMEIDRKRLNYRFKWGKMDWSGKCELTKRDSVNAF